jgi:hemoglobin
MMMNLMRRAAIMALTAAALHSPLSVADTMEQSAFAAMGGKDGLQKIAALGMDNVLADPRIKDKFVGANIPRLKLLLGTQFCALLEGGCTYGGKDMAAAHQGMNLRDADFNALAEDFRNAMIDLGVPNRAQNVLLAKLAPMEKPITAH